MRKANKILLSILLSVGVTTPSLAQVEMDINPSQMKEMKRMDTMDVKSPQIEEMEPGFMQQPPAEVKPGLMEALKKHIDKEIDRKLSNKNIDLIKSDVKFDEQDIKFNKQKIKHKEFMKDKEKFKDCHKKNKKKFDDKKPVKNLKILFNFNEKSLNKLNLSKIQKDKIIKIKNKNFLLIKDNFKELNNLYIQLESAKYNDNFDYEQAHKLISQISKKIIEMELTHFNTEKEIFNILNKQQQQKLKELF